MADRSDWMRGALAELPPCPPFPEFTELEARVLSCIAHSLGSDEEAFRSQIKIALVVDRINTGHGFYTRVTIDREKAPPAPLLARASGNFEVAGLEHGLGITLWDRDKSGYLETIEGYGYGSSRLEERGLNALKFLRPF